MEEWKRATHEFPKRGKRNIRNHINRFGYRRKETSHEWFFCSWNEGSQRNDFHGERFGPICSYPAFPTDVDREKRWTKGQFFSYLVLWHTNKCCIDLFDTANLLDLTLIEIWWLKFQRKSRAKIAHLFSLYYDFLRVCHWKINHQYLRLSLSDLLRNFNL